jgi:hypothetical protein
LICVNDARHSEAELLSGPGWRQNKVGRPFSHVTAAALSTPPNAMTAQSRAQIESQTEAMFLIRFPTDGA